MLCIAVQATPGFAADPSKLPDEIIRQIGLLLEEKATRTPAQQKMDSQLVHGAKIARGQAIAGLPNFKPNLKLNADGRVMVDIDATVTDALVAQIKAGGGQVIASVPDLHAVRALVSPVQAEALAGRADVRFIRPAAEATTNVGSVTSQGDVAHAANTFRTRTNADGTGIRVGVLSDSIDNLATSQSTGDLGAVTVLPGQGGAGTGEGTAMLEIVHDIAPGAELFFATAFSSSESFAQNIRDLRAAGCNIIIDDVSYFDESPFQDGVISQAVNDVSASGVLYFSAAGNSGNKDGGTSGTWEGNFSDGGPLTVGTTSYRIHSFGAATSNTVLSGGGNGRVDLFWADPLGGSSNDYDLFVTDAAFTTVLRASTNLQNGTQNPYESISTLNPGERIVIAKHIGAADRFLHLDTGRAWLTYSTAGKTRGHNASGAANAFSVAATSAASRTTPFTSGTSVRVEPYSSDGPRRVFFNPNGTAITPGNFTATGGAVLQKPDITAADGISTSVPNFTTFSGTSAAAPHAGAIAALLTSFIPTLTPAQVRTALQNSALDIETTTGVDRDSGFGIGMPVNALATLAVWVDFAAAGPGTGAFITPYNTLALGIANVPTNGAILVKSGSTPTTTNIPSTKPLRIQSVGGPVHIGP